MQCRLKTLGAHFEDVTFKTCAQQFTNLEVWLTFEF